VLSALVALLSDQLTCKRCATITNQPQSPLPPPAGQEPKHNVDNTAPISPTNNTELGRTRANTSSELMRYMLRDIKQLKTTIIRQAAAQGDGSKRHLANAYELHQRKKERPNRPRRTSRSASDDDDEYRLSRRSYRGCNTSPVTCLRATTRDRGYDVNATRDDGTVYVDRREHRQRFDNYSPQPPTPPRSSRLRTSVDDDVVGRCGDSFPDTSAPPRRHKDYDDDRPAGGQVATGAASCMVAALACGQPEYRHLEQQPFPRHARQLFRPHMPVLHPHQIQRQASAFRPIQQMAPAEWRRPLVFVPISGQHPTATRSQKH